MQHADMLDEGNPEHGAHARMKEKWAGKEERMEVGTGHNGHD